MNIKRTISLMILILLFFTKTVKATDYYINSSTGDSFIGDKNKPWKRI